MIDLTRRGALALLPGLLLARPARAAGTVLRMGDQRGNVRAVMEAAGVLRDLPYDLEWSEFVAAAPLLEALRADAIDAGYAGDAPSTFAFANGVPMRVIAATRSPVHGTAIVVAGSSPIKDGADLRGHTIATGRGSIGHFLLLAAMQKYGLTDKDVRIAFLAPADAHAALLGGSIDAWATWEPYTSQVEVIDHGRRVVDGTGLSPGQSYHVARTAAIAAKRPALEDFVRRAATARAWAIAHPDEYAADWAKLMGAPVAVPLNWFHRDQQRLMVTDDAVIANEQRVIDAYVAVGLLQHSFHAADAFDPSFNDAVRQGNAT